jgi:uncharacterized protein YcbX
VLIERIGFAPLKGAHHVEHATVDLTAAGPVGDRAFCLVDPERCRVLRTIEHPGLLQSVARWRPPTLSVDLLGVNLEGVPTQTGVRLEVDHWGRAASVEVVDGPWSAAFSAHLGRDVVLGRAIPGAVVYGAAVTLVTSSSARLLAEKLGTRVDSTRFRSTFVINTDELEPHVEDTWTGRPLNLGTAQVQIRGPLPRCAVIDLEPGTGRPDLKVLATLADYRRRDGEILYGVEAVVTRPATVQTGEPVNVGEGPATLRNG